MYYFDVLLLTSLSLIVIILSSSLFFIVYEVFFSRQWKYLGPNLLLLLSFVTILVPGFVLGWENYIQQIYDWANSDIDTLSELLQLVIFIIFISWDGISILGVLILLLFNSLRPQPVEIDPALIRSRYCFLITCHNSSDKIQKTIQSIQANGEVLIFIADNGSTELEIELTRLICLAQGTVYLNMIIGNKTFAQYFTVKHIQQNYPDIDVVISLDDDMIIPPNWNWSALHRNFASDNVAGLCFPLFVNNRINANTECQQLEYKLAGLCRVVHDTLGTTLFASGGFGAYRISVFSQVLEYHTGMFQAEDLRIGVILQNKFPGNVIQTCSEISIGTDVPVHFYHTHDRCSCEEPSLFRQRVRNWEFGRFFFFFYFVQTMYRSSYLIIKFLCCIEVLQMLNEHLVPLYLLVSLILTPGGTVKGLIIAISWTSPWLFLFWFFRLRNDVDLNVLGIYTLIYKPIYVVLRFVALIFFYWSIVQNRPPEISIQQRMEQSQTMSRELSRLIQLNNV